MNGITRLLGRRRGSGDHVFTGAIGASRAIGVLRGGARQQQHGRKMHDAAEQGTAKQAARAATRIMGSSWR